ncbi:MAG TPA: hypothetical protein VD994_18245 [Prosthecobacter sp.]|nr:hypothetical protein [Prosthecobacter sp.]
MTESSAESRYETYASVIAPAAVGAALGILFGRGMRRGPSNITALTLLAAGAMVAAPVITDLVRRTANRPSTDRGSRRRLEGIRSGGMDDELKDFFVDSPNALLP